jgi:hypothetical protein
MRFGEAFDAMLVGNLARRSGWNGKGMYIFIVKGSRFTVNREPLRSILGDGTEVDYHPHIDMKTAQGYVTVWTPSQPDLFATDWEIL